MHLPINVRCTGAACGLSSDASPSNVCGCDVARSYGETGPSGWMWLALDDRCACRATMALRAELRARQNEVN
jgi:hypothetical protein